MPKNGNGNGRDHSSPYHQLDPLPPPPDGYVSDVNLDGERQWVRQLFVELEWNRRIASTIADNQLRLAQGMVALENLRDEVDALDYRISNHERSVAHIDPEAS